MAKIRYVFEEYSIENEKNRNKDNMHYYYFSIQGKQEHQHCIVIIK